MVRATAFITMTLLSLPTFAFDRDAVCQAGFRSAHRSTILELQPAYDDNNELQAQINRGESTFLFYVSKVNNGYVFNAKSLDKKGIMNTYIEKLIPRLPHTEATNISDQEQVFIQCRPYTMTDYCREHTC